MSTDSPLPDENALPDENPQPEEHPQPQIPDAGATPTPEPPAPVAAAPAAAVAAVSSPPPASPPAPPAYPTTTPAQYQQAPQNTLGVVALIMGILQFFCLGIIGSILAIVFGRVGMNKAKAGLATNGGVAKAGFWLGIIGLILFVIGIIIVIIAAASGNSSFSFNVGSN